MPRERHETTDSPFSDSLKALRQSRGLSQQQLAAELFVNRSTVARWESGDRIPDLAIVPRIAECLGVDTTTLLTIAQVEEVPRIIIVDDEPIAIAGALSVLEDVFPGASITGFISPTDAIEYAQAHPVAIAFIEIEMGHTNGLELCEEMLELHPRTNVIFLTAYREYAFDAWKTGACGFMLKPMTSEAVEEEFEKLRHPVPGLQSTVPHIHGMHHELAFD